MAWNDDLEGPALAIASTDASPLRVIAGPGTGKTFALKRRVARFLEQAIDPKRILFVTFTRVSAVDIRAELEGLHVEGTSEIQAGTLHSYCFSLLNRAHVLEITKRRPRPLLGFEERFLLEDLGLYVDDDYYGRRRRLRAFEAAWAKEQSEEPGWPQSEVDLSFQGHLEEWLRFHKAMLIGELVPITLRYLRDNPACPERQQFTRVLVDEYQDLNKAEQRLVDLLAENSLLTVVGDEDQSIYETLRFAHPEGIAHFEETHQNTCDIPLDTCRRCPTNVVRMADRLIQNNLRRTGRRLNEKKDNPPGSIAIVQWQDMQAEADGIADFIAAKVKSGQFDPGKTLVLCPRRQFGYMIRDALRLPERDCAARSFFHEELLDGTPKQSDQEDCKAQEALTLMSLVANPDDRVALRCWLGFGHPNLRRNEYKRLWDYCIYYGSPRDVLEALCRGEVAIPHTHGITERYRLLKQWLADLSQRTTEEAFNVVFPEGVSWAEPFRTMARDNVEEWTPQNVVGALLTNITQPEMPTKVDYVRIMSLYKSKGLNADHVIVTGCVDGLIPSRGHDLQFEEEMRSVEEQRRLFFVAITRPKRTLVLSSVLRLPRGLAHRMGAVVVGGDSALGRTMTSPYVAELGPMRPTPIAGESWKY